MIYAIKPTRLGDSYCKDCERWIGSGVYFVNGNGYRREPHIRFDGTTVMIKVWEGGLCDGCLEKYFFCTSCGDADGFNYGESSELLWLDKDGKPAGENNREVLVKTGTCEGCIESEVA